MELKFSNPYNVSANHLKYGVANNQLRPSMNNVYVCFNRECLVVTNAHILISYPIKFEEGAESLDKEGVLLPLRFFDEKRYMIDVPPPAKRIKDLEYVLTDDYAEVYYLGELAFRCKYIDEQYPKYIQIMPTKNQEIANINVIGLDLINMERLTKAIPLPIKSVKLTFYGGNKGVFIETTNLDYDNPIQAIVMPILLNS